MKQCPHCDKLLRTTSGLKKHIALVHKNLNTNEPLNNSHEDILQVVTEHINKRVIYPVIDFIERMEQKLSKQPLGVVMYMPPPESEEERLWREQDLTNQKIILRTGAPMDDIVVKQAIQDELKENELFKKLSVL